MMKIKNIIFSIVWLGAGVLLTSLPQVSFGDEPIKIGVVQGLTGAAATYGVPMLRGAEVARDEYNGAGGILGRQIKFFVRDHKTRSDVARRVAEELVLQEKVHFLHGVAASPCGFAVSEVAKQYKVLYIDGGIKSHQLVEDFGHKYVASAVADNNYEGGAMATFEKDNAFKRYWLIGWDFAYGHNVIDSFKAKLKQVKPDAQIVGESWLKLGETELTPYITTILNSKADAIGGMLQGPSFIAFMKQQSPYGLLKKVHMINGAICGNAEFLIPLAKDMPDGVTLNAWHHHDYPNTPANRKFIKTYLDLTGDSFVSSSAQPNYVACKALFEAIKKAGSLDVDKVIDALTSLELEVPISPTKISFRKCDQKSNMGEIWGTSKYDPQLGYSKLSNPIYIPATLRSCEEVMAARARAATQKK